ncbi:DUF7711 family protein [Pseudonocardia sp. TRM90224]|uniref:DUF7711 family protein n=1 Tax=Pseudonocardia sp. TRM90224 TaxID=2812678 RepID=UPI001E4F9DE4|nr:hypothetical protein [Pseudonocardia sp. TRM90224]
MKWTRAVHHLRSLAEQCGDMAGKPESIFPLRVRQVWAFGELLGEQRDLDQVQAALVVDLPVEDLPWLAEPQGAEHWMNATRTNKNPVRVCWRSMHAPVWNHEVERPALVWDIEAGVDEKVLDALTNARAEPFRQQAPTAEERRARIDDELAVCLQALRRNTKAYDERRWGRGSQTSAADRLWLTCEGYLDVLDAVQGT